MLGQSFKLNGSIETYAVAKGLNVQNNRYENEWIFLVRGTWEYIQYLLWWIAKENIPEDQDTNFHKMNEAVIISSKFIHPSLSKYWKFK